MNLLSMDDLRLEDINWLLSHAEQSEQIETQNQLTAALLFYEPSTRTKLSFDMACHQLGVHQLDFQENMSSVSKGESLYDTVKTIESIGADFIVIRHPKENYYKELEQISIPVINAGDGSGEHPSQCLLDLLTIKQEFDNFEGLKVAIAGDIKHSRVAKSNAKTLERLGAEVSFVSPMNWQDQTLSFPYITMDEACENADVLMLLRVQHERHVQQKETNIDSYLEQFGLTKTREKMMKDTSIIMHPAPINRGIEIDSDLVEIKRSRIFKQMKNGVKMRKAIINYCLHKEELRNENIN
ncbi:aspartate carbamoyltransferase catalytic subunit [Halalkalibacillus halophilus]|uniref:aspartate carbamoyltransferase catalytic subunit n=1 Tax=Halalkalibacillus halophilus TaxID=392827 RepID=UPI00040E205C